MDGIILRFSFKKDVRYANRNSLREFVNSFVVIKIPRPTYLFCRISVAKILMQVTERLSIVICEGSRS